MRWKERETKFIYVCVADDRHILCFATASVPVIFTKSEYFQRRLPCKVCACSTLMYIENKVYFMCISQDMNDKVMCFIYEWSDANADRAVLPKKKTIERNEAHAGSFFVSTFAISTSTIYFIFEKESTSATNCDLTYLSDDLGYSGFNLLPPPPFVRLSELYFNLTDTFFSRSIFHMNFGKLSLPITFGIATIIENGMQHTKFSCSSFRMVTIECFCQPISSIECSI